MSDRKRRRVGGKGSQSDKDAFLEPGGGEGTEKLTHRLHADLPCLPMFALHAEGGAIPTQQEIDAAIGVGTATPLHLIAKLAVDEGDDLLELKPVEVAELLRELAGSAGACYGPFDSVGGRLDAQRSASGGERVSGNGSQGVRLACRR